MKFFLYSKFLFAQQKVFSPSLLRSSTAPISLRYNLTGSSVLPVCFFSSSPDSSSFFIFSCLADLIKALASSSETIFMLFFFKNSSTLDAFSIFLNFFGIAFSTIFWVYIPSILCFSNNFVITALMWSSNETTFFCFFWALIWTLVIFFFILLAWTLLILAVFFFLLAVFFCVTFFILDFLIYSFSP